MIVLQIRIWRSTTAMMLCRAITLTECYRPCPKKLGEIVPKAFLAQKIKSIVCLCFWKMPAFNFDLLQRNDTTGYRL